ncbi:MAG: T9SS type A sorting domain-containing protein [Bacteroidia bacterium]
MYFTKSIFVIFLLLSAGRLGAQFHPPAGVPGTSAIHVDSSAFIAWATNCVVERGLQQIGVDSLGFANVGIDEYGTGKAMENPVVSLGDGGIATLMFQYPIKDEVGWDFAVFENSFDGLFLELAFVEVSSDGENFVRFPATFLSDSNWTIGSFDYLDAHLLNNLAGKYAGGFGTPFDLQELVDSAGIDIQSITHVRLIDVIGIAQSDMCSRDHTGAPILDPFPTPWPSGGFDLDAIGVIHHQGPNSLDNIITKEIKVFPQPAISEVNFYIEGNNENISDVEVFSSSGQLMMKFQRVLLNKLSFDISSLESGIYFIRMKKGDDIYSSKFSVLR